MYTANQRMFHQGNSRSLENPTADQSAPARGIEDTGTSLSEKVRSTHHPGDLEEIGLAIASVIREGEEDILIVASNDMSHFLPDERARSVDKMAIEKVLELDPMGLLETVERERISMCGVAQVAAALVAANELGASKAELIKYATSGDIFGDRAQVVGYAGIRII